MMPPRSVGGRFNGHSTRRKYVRRLGWLLSSKLEMRLSAWVMQFALPATTLASSHFDTVMVIKLFHSRFSRLVGC